MIEPQGYLNQNSSRSINSRRRGAPVPVAPVFKISVILPKLAEGFGELPVKDPKLLDGFLYVGWLSKLKAAARKSKPNLSDSLKVFVSELSISKLRGPRAMNRPRLPHVPFAGRANAAGLSQLEVV